MLRRLLVAMPVSLFATVLLTAGSVSAGGGCHSSGGTSEGAGTAVELRMCAFRPTILHVQPGETVTWTNRDYLPHLVTGVGWGDATPLAQGQAVTYRFATAGIYPYTCSLHSGMSGAVVAGNGIGVGRPADVASVSLSTPAPSARVSTATPTGERDRGVWPALAAALCLLAGVAGYGLAQLRRA